MLRGSKLLDHVGDPRSEVPAPDASNSRIWQFRALFGLRNLISTLFFSKQSEIVMRAIKLLTASFFLALAGCGYVEKDDWMPVQTRNVIGEDAALLTRFMSGNTLVSYLKPRRGGHGWQYEYHSPDGKTLLWYPGNRRLVPGEWKVEAAADGSPSICYRYGANTYNPVTKTGGGGWECRAGDTRSGDTALKGDPFNLTTNGVPFVMTKEGYYAPDEVMKRIGGDPARIDVVTNLAEL